MGLHSSKKHFGIAAFAVTGCHTLQGSWASLPVPASSTGRSRKHCAATVEHGKEGLPALLPNESLLPEGSRFLPRLPPCPLALLHCLGC